MSIKTVIFERNGHGITALDIDVTHWIIRSNFACLLTIYNRACRLAKGGTRLEYREGDSYREIPVDIKSIV